ncbi:MAG: Immunoglobulin I-set domain protein [Verrucomicrobia bacterium ADurb.Bin006]|nr:MAG: Immunoglobulin I-set domain protein [Verrucomicrobia bacterium ADurb.Bin006]
MNMKRTIVHAGAALASAWLALSASASVTPQGWWHYGEVLDYYADSSGNNRRFGFAYCSGGGGTTGAAIVPLGAGGPLGTTGHISTSSLYWTPAHYAAAAMWNPWPCSTADCAWNPPATDYVIECWILPEDTGISTTANRTWFFGSGSGDFSQPDRPAGAGGGGVYFAVTNNTELGKSQIGAFVIPNAGQGVPNTVQIGDYVDADTNSWMHIAVVSDNGTNTFYVNGVAKGAPTDKNTIPNGNIFAGGSPGTLPSFRGYLDELRISTFAPGQFQVSDLLLRPAGPSIVEQPKSATVWASGAASFGVVAAKDASLTYQWRRGGANLPGQTGAKLYLATVTAADNGAKFDCVLTSGGVSVTSAEVTLTVVTPTQGDIDDANAYRNLVKAESGLVAYFPADDCVDATVINVVDNAHNGTLQLGALYDGQTDRALIQRSLAFDADGMVQIPSDPAFEFPSGNGTVEALVYLTRTTIQNQTIFSVAWDNASYVYAIQANGAGNSLVFANGVDTLSWSIAPSLIGRLTHVAFVFEDGTKVTPYLDGKPLETKTHTGLGAGGYPAWIGSFADGVLGDPNMLAGTIGDLAVYSSALSADAIQSHYTKLVYGTTVAPPVFDSQTLGPRTLMAGSAPVLNAVVSGALPFTYQWKLDGVAIPGANSASYVVTGGAAGTSATYTLSVENVFGIAESQPIVLNFVAPSGKYAEIVAADHPSAYWRLGEATGTLAADVAGFHDATYGGAYTLGEPGAFLGGAQTDPDTAVHFTGGNAVAQASSVLNPAGPFTVEFWAKPDQSGQNSRCVIGSQNRAIGRSGYAIYQGLNGAWWECHIGDATTVQIWLLGKTYPEAGKWYHVVVVYSGGSGRIYVNGVDDTSLENSTLEGNYLPATNTPFEIASRSGGGIPYPGTVDDVAFYSYALTPEQILNHYKIQWMAAQVTEEPADASAVEGSTVTLSAAVSGLPNTYQWFKGAVALTDVTNPDGTAHYPQGVNAATLVIAQATPSDSGLYRLVVENPLGGVTTRNANVVVSTDTAPPSVVSVTALSTPNPIGGKPFLVKVLFSKRMDSATASSPGNYGINGGVAVNSLVFHEDPAAVPLGGDWRTVILATSGLVPGQEYTLTLSGLKDRTTTGNVMPSTTVSFQAPVLTPGVVAWDYYYLGAPRPSPLTVNWMTDNTYLFPAGPMTNGLPASFDTTPFTGGNLATKPVFGSHGDDYGDSLSAWITPTVSGNYRFFLSSDDPSQLWLSTNEDPVNVGLIAEETGCCHAFTEPPIAYTSEPQALVAGKAYFIQALHTEGGGGDYLKVAWRIEGDETPAGQLTPISGAVISAYAPVAAPEFDPPVITGTGQITLSWSGAGALQQSPDFKTWTPVAGNPTSPYTVAPSAAQMFYRIAR